MSQFVCQSKIYSKRKQLETNVLFGSSFSQCKKIGRQCGALAGVCFFGFLFSLSSRAERLPVKTYTVADGLLRDAVYKIKQDSRGFLWFCTAEGVSRFDGYGFTNFTIADGLPDGHANDFLETRNGIYFFATGGGLARLNLTRIRGSSEARIFTKLQTE